MEKTTILFREIKETEELLENKLNEYIGKEGVWALYAKEDDGYICLNVGKSKNIGSEILYDISCMHYLNTQEGDICYYNQFGEDCDLTWKSGFTQEYLYPRIYDRYNEFAFVLVCDTSDARVEKEFAWATHAKYWRNGKSYTQKRDGVYEKYKEANCGEFKCSSKIKRLDECVTKRDETRLKRDKM